MPDKQKMRAKARELLDSPRGREIRRNNEGFGNSKPFSNFTVKGRYFGRDADGRRTPVDEASRRVKPDSNLSADVIREAYELDAAKTPRLRTLSSKQVGPMTEDTRRQTRRGVRGEAPKFADGGKVRGDGICQRGKTKGRLV
jgi:hypothetical protein